MKPVTFPEVNCTFAKNQPEYLPLETYKDEEGQVTSCWKMSFWECLKVLISGRIWITVMTFNKPLQPQKISVNDPFVI